MWDQNQGQRTFQDEITFQKAWEFVKRYGLAIFVATLLGGILGGFYKAREASLYKSEWTLTGPYLYNVDSGRINRSWVAVFNDPKLVEGFASRWLESADKAIAGSPLLKAGYYKYLEDVCQKVQFDCNGDDRATVLKGFTRYLLKFAIGSRPRANDLPLNIQMTNQNIYSIALATSDPGLMPAFSEASNLALIHILELYRTSVKDEKVKQFELLRDQVEDSGVSWSERFENSIKDFESEETALQLQFAGLKKDLDAELKRQNLPVASRLPVMQNNPAIEYAHSSSVLVDFHQALAEELYLENLEQLRRKAPKEGERELMQFVKYREKKSLFETRYFTLVQTFQGTKGVLGDTFASVLAPLAVDSIPPVPDSTDFADLVFSSFDVRDGIPIRSGVLMGAAFSLLFVTVLSGVLEIFRRRRFHGRTAAAL